MHILIIGAAGMIGRKLTERLVATASSTASRSTSSPWSTWSSRRSRPALRGKVEARAADISDTAEAGGLSPAGRT